MDEMVSISPCKNRHYGMIYLVRVSLQTNPVADCIHLSTSSAEESAEIAKRCLDLKATGISLDWRNRRKTRIGVYRGEFWKAKSLSSLGEIHREGGWNVPVVGSWRGHPRGWLLEAILSVIACAEKGELT